MQQTPPGPSSAPPRMGAAAALRDWTLGARDWLRSLPPRRAPLAQAATAHPSCVRATVLVLPGILENERFLRPLLEHLSAQGHPILAVPRLGQNLRTVEASVEIALDALESAGRPRAVILAHSKGGLIGRELLADPRSRDLLHGMVAIAAPFHGSLLWPWLQASRLVRASPLGLFHPRSRFLVRTDRPAPADSRIVSLLPRGDQVVSEGSHLEGATNIALPAAGHFGSVRDPRCWELVHEQLDQVASRAADEGARSA